MTIQDVNQTLADLKSDQMTTERHKDLTFLRETRGLDPALILLRYIAKLESRVVALESKQ